MGPTSEDRRTEGQGRQPEGLKQMNRAPGKRGKREWTEAVEEQDGEGRGKQKQKTNVVKDGEEARGGVGVGEQRLEKTAGCMILQNLPMYSLSHFRKAPLTPPISKFCLQL